MNETTATPSFTFVEHWQKDDVENGEAVLAFWRRENAIGDETSAKKRLGEIVLHARDAGGAIAGVSTAVPITLPRLGQPTYYFRCFVGKDWRKSRLVLHLPLIVPEDCGFRVGGETRSWREGEAWIFDDTINHEAWNDSDKPRAILICDVWNPYLSVAEREGMRLAIEALGRFNRAHGGKATSLA